MHFDDDVAAVAQPHTVHAAAAGIEEEVLVDAGAQKRGTPCVDRGRDRVGFGRSERQSLERELRTAPGFSAPR